MIKTVIYGGSFDPLHIGHEQIINELSKRFDRVIVVPTHISPFKSEGSSASDELRLQMLKSVKFPSNVQISDFELNNDRCSYTIYTLKHYSSENQKMYFCLGSEGVRSLPMWRNFDELIALCVFYVVPRSGYDDYRGCESYLEYADFSVEDISSSEIKAAMAIGKEDYYVSEAVANIIKKYGLYTDYSYVSDVYKMFGMKQQRIEHSFRATVEGIKLAKRYNVNVSDTIVALLMHDIGKYVTPEILEKHGISVPQTDLPPECIHAEYGAAICEQYLRLPKHITEAVRSHTTCALEMDKLAEIVALADYIEAGRSFDGINDVRLAARRSLSEAIELMLKGTIQYLQKKGNYIAPIALQVYEKYKEINRRENKNGN